MYAPNVVEATRAVVNKEVAADNQYQSAIVSRLAVCGLEEGGQRKSAAQQAYEVTQQSIKLNIARGRASLRRKMSHVRLVQGITQQFMVLMSSDV
jgi:N-acyl-L-homoserine lactone synthetase